MLRVLNNSFDAQVFALGLERDGHVAVAAVAPEPTVGGVEDGGEITFFAFNLFTLAVAVELAIRAVVGLTVGIVVDRYAICRPLVADRGLVQHFQLDFTSLARLQRDSHLIGLQG